MYVAAAAACDMSTRDIIANTEYTSEDTEACARESESLYQTSVPTVLQTAGA